MARRLSVFAGAGRLVPQVVAAAQAAGYKVQVLAFAPQQPLGSVRVIKSDLAHPLHVILRTRLFWTSHIVMIGAISLSGKQRESLARFAFGRRKRRGPAQPSGLGDAALSGIGRVLKTLTGADLIGVHDIMPELLAPEGQIAGPAIDETVLADADFALHAAREIGRLDIGQAAITAGRHIIAVEDIAGTDSLIARVGGFVKAGLAGNGQAPLILAKAVKPQQTLAIDLPTIGPETIRNASAAGISIVAVDAGAVLLVDRAELAALANQHGITVIGRRRG